MSEEKIDLSEALKILEISTLEGVSEKDLKGIKRKAAKRWHPDTIAHAKPSDERKREYERNFRLIGVAIDYIRAYLRGETHAGKQFSGNYEAETRSKEMPEDVIRRNASRMQELLRRTFDEIRETGYKVEKTVVELSDGFLIKELLNADLKDNILVAGLMAVLGCLLYYTFASILGVVISLVSPQLGEIYFTLISVAFLVQAFLSILAIVPLSRFWLPARVSELSLQSVNFGLSFYDWFGSTTRGGVFSLAISLMIIAMRVVAESIKWFLVVPAYMITGMIFSERRIGVVKQEVTYFAGAADWYADKLVDSEISELNSEDLMKLSYLYNQYKDVWGKWSSKVDYAG